ncbi:PAS domain-containing protein [Pleomorphochaeta sp. DL1XJH-081]|uniref:PAS domain-containing protein n=1 Tax=Pleomorphochaeta sp. DL1XJH-081 TaxID=3409690 RepID=UPI003BB705D6
MEISSTTHSERFGILLPYCLGLADPASNKKNLELAKPLFDTVTPEETMVLVDTIMGTVDDIELTKIIVTRMLHSFTKALSMEVRSFDRSIPYFEQLLERNNRIQTLLDELKPIVTRMNGAPIASGDRTLVTGILNALDRLTDQYVMKENILFPVVERFVDENKCVQLMWAIHDDIRLTLSLLKSSIQDESVSIGELNRLFGRLFFDMRSMVFREEKVLLPAILPKIPRNALLALSEEQADKGQVNPNSASLADGRIDLVTGNPTAKQLLQIFNNLPVDITLVDDQDRVVYFNTPEHRIFPRAKSVVGRTVQNCHPPKSVHIVQQILDAFKSKKRDSAEFRITVGGKYIRISYQAIYDEDGTYAGTLEVSQDITGLKDLEGDVRLLQWGLD